MPRYEYQCRCGEKCAKTYRMGQAPVMEVCRCGQEATRIFSVPEVSVNSLFSDANRQGLAAIDATAKTDEKAYNKR